MSLFTELKRRKVFKVGAAYLVVGWLFIQVSATVMPQFDVPAWAARMVTLLVALGFPVALVLAWAFDVTPDGVKLDASRAGSKRIFVAAAVLAALALGWYFRGSITSNIPASAPVTPVSASKPGTATTPPQKSIAVLAFTDLSPKHDQDYFSDGIAEELLNALAQIKDLKVAGRTSSFYYKGRNEDLRAIGKALGVANVLEGSVRTQGDKVRITAQLIRSEDGFHLWSETYDGDLKDVFALQERIARSITDQLKVVLAGKQAERLVNTGTENPEAYSLYLQATSIFNRRDGVHYQDAITALQGAIRLDPNFARAYSRLAALHVVLTNFVDDSVQTLHDRVAEYAQKASALDPTLAEPYAALGFSLGKFPGRLVEQREAFDWALALDGDDVTTNFWYGLALLKTGYRERGLSLIEGALEKDPLLPNALRWRGIMYLYAGDTGRAEMLLNRARDVGLNFADRTLAEIAEARGDNVAATRLLASGLATALPGMPPDSNVLMAEGVYGNSAARARALAFLDAYLAKPHEHIAGMIPVNMFLLGEPAKALAVEHKQLTGDNTDFMVLLWSPRGKAMRDLPEFQPFLRDLGFVELWDKYGSPDLCRKNAAAGYVCE